MVIKILKSSKVFQAIHYNEEKVEKGEARLMSTNNLIDNDGTKDQYIGYLKNVGSLNKRVKNKQFHVVLSAKGNDSLNHEDLNLIALDYMKYMGYEYSPFLVYAHNDTDNSHVHVVASRVDKKGNKISDKFEKVRSQKFIEQHLKVDYKKSVNQHIDDALRYKFSTIPQFKLLLERQNYKIIETDTSLIIKKTGSEVAKILRLRLMESLVKTDRNSTDLNKTKAILAKYSDGRNLSEITRLLRSKFGIELVAHHGKGNHIPKWPGHEPRAKPYGYTIIDHQNRQIYKGSELLKLSYLLNGKNRKKNLEIINPLIKAALGSDISFTSLKSKLRNHGYDLTSNGTINEIDNKVFIKKLEDEDLRKIKYSERAAKTKTVLISRLTPPEVIAMALFIKVENSGRGDIGIPLKMIKDYQGKVSTLLQQGHNFDILFNKNQLRVITHSSGTYLYDKDQNVLLDIEKDLRIKIKSKNSADINNINKAINDAPDSKSLFTENPVNTFFKLVNWSFYDDGEDDQIRKRKKQQKL